MKITTLKPGMTVYAVGRQKMGNTTLTTVAVWTVRIVEVDETSNIVIASWNGNAPSKFREGDWSKWRLQRPLLVSLGFGQRRLATRAEVAAAKSQA